MVPLKNVLRNPMHLCKGLSYSSDDLKSSDEYSF